MDHWDSYFLSICKSVAQNSKCKSRKIGAILVRDKSIVATGYNGPPRGVPPCSTPDSSNLCPRRSMGFQSGEGLEYCPAAHAEVNCISNAARLGVSTLDTVLYANCEIPCKNCLAQIINAGIKEIVVLNTEHQYDDLTSYILKYYPNLVRRY